MIATRAVAYDRSVKHVVIITYTMQRPGTIVGKFEHGTLRSFNLARLYKSLQQVKRGPTVHEVLLTVQVNNFVLFLLLKKNTTIAPLRVVRAKYAKLIGRFLLPTRILFFFTTFDHRFGQNKVNVPWATAIPPMVRLVW